MVNDCWEGRPKIEKVIGNDKYLREENMCEENMSDIREREHC